jgi:hypothetical protein
MMERIAVLETKVEVIEERFRKTDRLLLGILGGMLSGAALAAASLYVQLAQAAGG